MKLNCFSGNSHDLGEWDKILADMFRTLFLFRPILWTPKSFNVCFSTNSCFLFGQNNQNAIFLSKKDKPICLLVEYFIHLTFMSVATAAHSTQSRRCLSTFSDSYYDKSPRKVGVILQRQRNR